MFPIPMTIEEQEDLVVALHMAGLVVVECRGKWSIIPGGRHFASYVSRDPNMYANRFWTPAEPDQPYLFRTRLKRLAYFLWCGGVYGLSFWLMVALLQDEEVYFTDLFLLYVPFVLYHLAYHYLLGDAMEMNALGLRAVLTEKERNITEIVLGRVPAGDNADFPIPTEADRRRTDAADVETKEPAVRAIPTAATAPASISAPAGVTTIGVGAAPSSLGLLPGTGPLAHVVPPAGAPPTAPIAAPTAGTVAAPVAAGSTPAFAYNVRWPNIPSQWTCRYCKILKKTEPCMKPPGK